MGRRAGTAWEFLRFLASVVALNARCLLRSMCIYVADSCSDVLGCIATTVVYCAVQTRSNRNSAPDLLISTYFISDSSQRVF
jgi:hypothetical protein